MSQPDGDFTPPSHFQNKTFLLQLGGGRLAAVIVALRNSRRFLSCQVLFSSHWHYLLIKRKDKWTDSSRCCGWYETQFCFSFFSFFWKNSSLTDNSWVCSPANFYGNLQSAEGNIAPPHTHTQVLAYSLKVSLIFRVPANSTSQEGVPEGIISLSLCVPWVRRDFTFHTSFTSGNHSFSMRASCPVQQQYTNITQIVGLWIQLSCISQGWDVFIENLLGEALHYTKCFRKEAI